MEHLVAYYESVDGGAVLQPLAAVPDSILYVVGDQVRVPAELPYLGGATLMTTATNINQMQMRTPTLRELFYPSFAPLSGNIVMNQAYMPLSYFPESPLELTGLEQMELWHNTDNTGAVNVWGLAWLQDGPIQPVTGQIYTIRATGTATLAAGQWVNTQLTFDQQLPVGDYQVVGMKAIGTNLTAARLVFQGYPWRPGVAGSSSVIAASFPHFRSGMKGVMGTFNNNVPPTVDCLGVTDTAQQFYLDLIKVG